MSRLKGNEVNFEVIYEGYQNCAKTHFMNILRILVINKSKLKLTAIPLNFIMSNSFFMSLSNSSAV